MATVNATFVDVARKWPPERIEQETGRPGSVVWRWDQEYDAYKIGLALDIRGRYDGLPKFLFSRIDGRPLNAMANMGNDQGVALAIALKINQLVEAARGQTQFELSRDIFEEAPPQLEQGEP